ncbi:MAG: saccharopine dehydrogenase NADP-binding domain-containing protein, partial [Candidatus Margulisbacteria bacterium]|nr:saccharopine dehydrogenase NADP-binding domain-containing protein [Candidatus Margulisiibacteriota bacterium]
MVMTKEKYSGKILIIGCGAVAQCAIPLIIKHIDIPLKNITIMDYEDYQDKVKDTLAKGVKYVFGKIVKENMAQELAKYVGSGDMIIDLAFNIDCLEILQWCHDRNILYVNASVEEWDPFAGQDSRDPRGRTLYHRHMLLRNM